MPNRLAQETSPYLLQHKDNPIDWHPWGEEAFLRAKLEDKPIFLSVGYSSCHWCHVMAHESFEDPEVALALNSSFISIKLDREERPDVDEVYMTAVQVATGRGGWPMTVFMTPDKKPFFAGTYFPRSGRGQVPGFLTIVNSLASSWKEDRAKVEQTAQDFSAHLKGVLNRSLAPSAKGFDLGLADRCVAVHMEAFDGDNGGFGDAPKFPPHTALSFFEAYAYIRPGLPPSEGLELTPQNLADSAVMMSLFTLQQMIGGGIHDAVGGGFHRYSTDATWLLPHFEKMLYDNAQILNSLGGVMEFLEENQQRALYQWAAEGIISWLDREMTSPEGMFYSAIDADSEGEEGLFYTWSSEEIEAVLGNQAPPFMEAFGVTPEGNFREEATGTLTGRSILHGAPGMVWQSQLDRLLQARSARVRPETDTKCLCGWNGLMISALVKHGALDRATRCAQAWLDHRVEGRLPHQVSGGIASGKAFLDDYAYFIDALLDLYQATQDEKWSDAVQELLPQVPQNFQDSARGGFFFTPHDGEELLGRTKPYFDNVMPSGNGVMLKVYARVGLHEEAAPHFAAAMAWAERIPDQCETVLAAMMMMLAFGAEPAAEEALSVPAAAPAAPAQIPVYFTPREIVADKDGWGHAMVTISLPEGVHINTNDPPARWLVPTSLRVEGVLGEAGFPDSEGDRYEGEVNIPVRLRSKSRTEEFGLTVRFQPCTDSECFEAVERQFSGVLIVEP